MSHKPAVVLFAVLALHLTVSTAAQERPASVFGEQIEVRVVNLEVVVEDRAGNRVSGLGLDDFRLRIDGEEVPIGYFTEIAEGRRVEERPQTLAGGEIRTTPGVGNVDPGEEVGTSYLVFIDDYFTTVARDRNRVLRGIVDSLERLGPEDRMAVVAFDGRRIEMLNPWTRSKSKLRSTFEQAIERAARGLRTSSLIAHTDTVSRLNTVEAAAQDSAFGQQDGNSLRLNDGSFNAASREAGSCATIQLLEKNLERVVLGVTATLRSFSKPDGRKVMLLLSGGWPNSAYDYVLGPTTPINQSGECSNRGPEIFQPIYDVANLLGYTLYPIDMLGNQRLSVDAGVGDDVALSRNGPSIDGATNPQAPGLFTRQAEQHTTLRRIAGETGGRPMIAGANLTAFDSIIDDTRSYYWLGFSPRWKGDDNNHKIKLEVGRPGLEVRYREGYRDLSRAKEISFMVESALVFGELPGSSPLKVRLGEVPARGRRVEVPLVLTIPMDEITMLPHQGRYVAELELRIGALDDKGNRNEITVVPVVLSGDAPPPPGAHATYEVVIKIQRKSQDLVFALYDPLGDTILAAVTRLEI